MDPAVVEPLDSFGWAYDPSEHDAWTLDDSRVDEMVWRIGL
jgi:hypothetical protein